MSEDLPACAREYPETFTQEVEQARARAAWSRLRYLTPHQRFKAARETRALRTPAVFRVALADASAATGGEAKLAEEWATFAVDLLELLPAGSLSAEQRKEHRGEGFGVLGNSRRRTGDFPGSAAAFQAAQESLPGGTSAARARVLSFQASLAYDMGDLEGAVDLISQSRQIYAALRDRHGLARLGIKHANFLREVQPAEARTIAADTLLVLPRTELRLEMLAHCIIAETLAESQDGRGAMERLQEARPLLSQFNEEWLACRLQFLEARILEALGFLADAERLYAEAARLSWHSESYRESFMIRLRQFEFYLGRKRHREAAEVCRKAVVLLGETSAHGQMKEVWQSLQEATETHALKVDCLPDVRNYMVRHWCVPAHRLPLQT